MLLTIALIMRANYSVTRQRRWDRITGTLIGCAMAVALIALSPPALLLTVIVLAIGLSPCLCRGALSHHGGRRLDLVAGAAAFLRARPFIRNSSNGWWTR